MMGKAADITGAARERFSARSSRSDHGAGIVAAIRRCR
jgi:hypothetical protein